MLLVANDGGHLAQLHALQPRLPNAEIKWMTTSTPQSESLLADADVHWLHPAPTRDATAVLRNATLARRLIVAWKPDIAVSTGSSMALSVLPQIGARRKRAVYIESATRTDGPSLSGRILARVPGVFCYSQYQHWATGRWAYAGSVFDGFRPEQLPNQGSGSDPLKLLVSLGTSRTYHFNRLLNRLREVVPSQGVEITWQIGATSGEGLSGRVAASIPALELERLAREADVVVAHAGTGIALTCLRNGKLPILVPRRPELGEHVDDHQLQIADMLGTRGLAIVKEADVLTWDDLSRAQQSRVSQVPAAPLELNFNC